MNGRIRENCSKSLPSPCGFAASTTLTLMTVLPSLVVGQETPVGDAPKAARTSEIRVDTKVYLKGDEAPIQANRTLFLDSMRGLRTYDFVLGINPETTILDMGDAPHFTMLSPKRGVKCIVPLLRVDEFSAHQRQRSNFTPKFQITQAGDILTLKSDELTYRVKLMDSRIPECHGKYELFATWYARLNAMRPHNIPSGGRETLNQEVAKRRKVPQEIWRSMVIRGQPQVEVRSTHDYIGKWTAEDRKMVAKADLQLRALKEVTVEEFFNPKPVLGDQAAK